MTDHWFEDVAAHARSAYLRYSFTKGTEQEVGFLVDLLELRPGSRVLDVGCGPGRHALALAARGITVHGIDISTDFIEIATEQTPEGAPATFERMDARAMPFDSEFDAAISLCQGAFGLIGGDDDVRVLEGMARAVRPHGRVCLSAFSAYFQVRWLEQTDTFDAATGVNHERTKVKDESGRDEEFDLWTTTFTPRELRLLAERAGLRVRELWSVAPGSYRRREPSIEEPEFLLVAERP